MRWFLLALILLSFQASPAITVSPGSGQPGASLVVNGSDFTAGARVKVYWDGANLGGTLRIAADGTFRYSGNVPGDAAIGSHTVSARTIGGTSEAASATFTVGGATTTTAVTTTTAAQTTTTAVTTTTTATSGTAVTTTTATSGTAVTTTTTATSGAAATTTTAATGTTAAPSNAQDESSGTTVVEPPTGDDSATEEQATASDLPATSGDAGDSSDPPSPAAAQGGSDEPATTGTTSDGFLDASGLPLVPIAIAALILGTVLLVAFRRRSKRDPEPAPPAPPLTVGDTAVVAPIVAAGVHAGDGDWTRDILTLDPPGGIDGLFAGSDRLTGCGQVAGANGDASTAAVWQSTDGISWQSLAMLGPGVSRLVVPWQDGLLVAAVHELDERVATTCWWVDGAGVVAEQPFGEEPLRGVVEGGTATDDVAMMWGRGSQGPRVWVAEAGSPWRESDRRSAVDFIASSGGNFVAFGRQGSSSPSVAYSADGISWSESSVIGPGVFEGARMVAAMPFAGRFVAGGTDIMRNVAAVWTTEDGQNWDRIALPSAATAHLVDLVAAGDRLLAVGGDRNGGRRTVAVWESDDALTWRSVAHSELFEDSSADALAVLGDSILVCGTQYIEREDAEPRAVPVTWRSRVPGSTEPSAPQEAPPVAAGELEPIPAR